MRCRLKCVCKRKTLVCLWLLYVGFRDTLVIEGFLIYAVLQQDFDLEALLIGGWKADCCGINQNPFKIHYSAKTESHFFKLP